MVVRVVIGIFLVGLFTVGCYLLLLGALLHFDSDASDPLIMVVGRTLWLTYLASLDLFWGASAVSMLWPGQRSSQLRRLLGYGAIAVSTSGAILMAVAYINDHGRFFLELAGLVLISGLTVGFSQLLLARHTVR